METSAQTVSSPTQGVSASTLNADQYLPFETLVWAKAGRNVQWPAQITDPSLKECTRALPQRKDGALLCHFFGTYDYSYVKPFMIHKYAPGQSDRLKRSRMVNFVKGCKEIEVAHETGVFPEVWHDDDPCYVAKLMDYIQAIRPDIIHDQQEEDRKASLGLFTIDDHAKHGFKCIAKPCSDAKGKKRREYRTEVMQRLALCSPPELVAYYE